MGKNKKLETVKAFTFKVNLEGGSAFKLVEKIVAKFEVLTELTMDGEGNVIVKGETYFENFFKCAEKVRKHAKPVKIEWGLTDEEFMRRVHRETDQSPRSDSD